MSISSTLVDPPRTPTMGTLEDWVNATFPDVAVQRQPDGYRQVAFDVTCPLCREHLALRFYEYEGTRGYYCQAEDLVEHGSIPQALGRSDLSLDRELRDLAPMTHVPAPVEIPTTEPGGLAARVLRWSDLCNLPEPEPLIADTLDRRTVALLAGYHGTGKSFVAMGWAACVATGRPWMGREVRQGRVLYLMGEGAQGIDQRLAAWMAKNGISTPSDDLRVLPEAVQLANPAAVDALIEYIDEEGPFALVVVDTLARAAVGLDENSAKDVGLVVAATEKIKRALDGGTVLVVHHTGKDKTTVRGSSALEAAVDTAYTTEGDVASKMILRRTKRKEGPKDDALFLRLEVVGQSGVLVNTDAVKDAPTANPAVQEAFDELRRALAGMESFTKTDAAMVLMEALSLSRASAYRRITDLVQRGWVRLEGDRYHFARGAAATGDDRPF